MPQYPFIPSYIFLQPHNSVTILRAPLANIDGLGPNRDWAHATSTVIYAFVNPVSESEQSVDREYTATHWELTAYGEIDLLATDRVQFQPGQNSNSTITCEVDGDPFVWSDFVGFPNHTEAKLKILRGM